MKCLLLMNVISTCMSSINKRPQCSSLIRWWNQCTITTIYYIFFFAIYKANSKVFNFARTLTPMEMKVLENTSFVCFEVVFQYWVLFMGRKLFQTTQRNFFSNIITWWHIVTVVGDCIWVLHSQFLLCVSEKVSYFFSQWTVKRKFHKEDKNVNSL